MPDWATNGPLGLTILFLTGVAFLRAQLTYWVGRAIGEGRMRLDPNSEQPGFMGRMARHLRGERLDSAVEKLRKHGGPIIPLSFLTVGFQSFVQAAAGFVRMRWPVYTAWMLPGCVMWGVVYAVGGLAVWAGMMKLALASPWALAILLLAVGGFIAYRIGRRRRRNAGLVGQTSQ